jgi:hypothetical protein
VAIRLYPHFQIFFTKSQASSKPCGEQKEKCDFQKRIANCTCFAGVFAKKWLLDCAMWRARVKKCSPNEPELSSMLLRRRSLKEAEVIRHMFGNPKSLAYLPVFCAAAAASRYIHRDTMSKKRDIAYMGRKSAASVDIASFTNYIHRYHSLQRMPRTYFTIKPFLCCLSFSSSTHLLP